MLPVITSVAYRWQLNLPLNKYRLLFSLLHCKCKYANETRSKECTEGRWAVRRTMCLIALLTRLNLTCTYL